MGFIGDARHKAHGHPGGHDVKSTPTPSVPTKRAPAKRTKRSPGVSKIAKRRRAVGRKRRLRGKAARNR